jgi:lactoylglutathione lyase
MPKISNLNHVALLVADVEKSVRFYADIMQFEQLPRPAFDFDGAWFRLGTVQELHLIAGRTNMVESGSRNNHFALEIENLEEWAQHLASKNATFRPPKIRPDGAGQIFVQDPDGYFIELCDLTTRNNTQK